MAKKGTGSRHRPVVVDDRGPADPPPAEVLAAGGIVWRDGDDGPEVLVVHRPKYDDWSFPKGKLDPGETEAEAALREVEEETGLRCRLGTEVGTTAYVDAKGRQKSVRYWAMEVGSGSFTPNAEVDQLRWLRPGKARRRLTYRRDAVLLEVAQGVLGAE